MAITGGPITLEPNQNNSTTFNAIYEITQDDIDNEGVYNLAEVIEKIQKIMSITNTSVDPIPLSPSDDAL